MTDHMIVAAGLKKALVALEDMGFEQGDTKMFIGDLDLLDAEHLFVTLEQVKENQIMIAGCWRRGLSRGIDTHDLVLKHIEDNFGRARCKKSDDGWHVAIAGERLPNA